MANFPVSDRLFLEPIFHQSISYRIFTLLQVTGKSESNFLLLFFVGRNSTIFFVFFSIKIISVKILCDFPSNIENENICVQLSFWTSFWVPYKFFLLLFLWYFFYHLCLVVILWLKRFFILRWGWQKHLRDGSKYFPCLSKLCGLWYKIFFCHVEGIFGDFATFYSLISFFIKHL